MMYEFWNVILLCLYMMVFSTTEKLDCYTITANAAKVIKIRQRRRCVSQKAGCMTKTFLRYEKEYSSR